jgi:hypothetical protein
VCTLSAFALTLAGGAESASAQVGPLVMDGFTNPSRPR